LSQAEMAGIGATHALWRLNARPESTHFSSAALS
jgi:hypothetical protein